MSPGVTCIKCLGRIDSGALDMKRRLAKRLKKPYEPPRLCSECWLLALHAFCHRVEEDEG